MAYSFSVCYMPSKPNSFFYVDCETQLAADGKGNVYPVERSQFEASCRRDAETLCRVCGKAANDLFRHHATAVQHVVLKILLQFTQTGTVHH